MGLGLITFSKSIRINKVKNKIDLHEIVVNFIC